MKPVSAKRRRRDAVYPDRRVDVYERADGRCEAMTGPRCTGRCEQVHHLAGRGGPDPHRLDNLLGVCHPCHRWIEENRTEAYELGLLVRRNRDCPVCVPEGLAGVWCPYCGGTTET